MAGRRTRLAARSGALIVNLADAVLPAETGTRFRGPDARPSSCGYLLFG